MRKFYVLLFAVGMIATVSAKSQSPIYFSSFDYASPNDWAQANAALMNTVVLTNIHTTTPNGTGNKYFRFYSALSGGTTYEPNGGSDIQLTANTSANLQVTAGSGKAYFLNIANAASNVVFKSSGSGSPGSSKVVAFEVQGAIRSISSLSQSPIATNANAGEDVTVNVVLNGALATGQGVYLRYTKNGYSTSTVVQMTGAGVNYSAIIPAAFNTGGLSVVSYYVFTSGDTGPAANGSDADLYTINLINNGGANYSYTPGVIWTNPITGTNPNTADPYTTGQFFNANITVSGIGRGNGIAGDNANDRYNAKSWTTIGAVDPTDYFEFTLTPNSGYKIDFTNFVYTSQASTGTPTIVFRSSVDGFNANIATPIVTGATIDLSGSAYQSITSSITFRIYGYGFAAATTTFSINDFTFNGIVSLACTPPTITGNPTGQTVCVSSATTFSATSSATGVTYQWQMSADGSIGWTDVVNNTPTGVTYSNASTNTLGVVSTAAVSQYFYRCKITASSCDGFTTTAKLVVNATPTTTNPANPTAVCGTFGGTLSVTATGSLQWQYSIDGTNGWGSVSNGTPTGVSYTNATSQMLTIAGLTQTGYYRMLATATGCTAATSTAATVTVNALPADPAGNITGTTPACSSTTLNYSSPDANIYWQTVSSGSDFSSPTTSALIVSGSGTYYVRAYSGTCFSAGEKSLAVTINTPITIAEGYPANSTVVSPSGTNFTVAGGVTGTVTGYSWSYSEDAGNTWLPASGGVYSSNTTQTLTISSATGLNGNLYRVTISGTCGDVISPSAALTVNTPSYLWYNNITGTNPGQTASYYTTGNVVATNVNATGITKGTGVLGNAGNDRYNTSGWNSGSLDLTDYIELTLSPAATYRIDFTNLVYTSQASGSGPINFAIRSSVDNYTTNIATPGSIGGSISLSAAAFQGITSTISFRIYGWGASQSTGTFSVNDFTFNGKATAPCTLGTTPVANGNVSPQIDNTFTSAFTASWAQAANATGYSLDVSTSPTFAINSAVATSLFFSEYVEGSSNNKYLEIFNGTGSSVILSGYQVRLYINGSTTPGATYALTGTLNNGSVLVLRNASATTFGGTTVDGTPVMSFNGDDAIELYNSNTSTSVDIFGTIGEDPGTAWTANGGYTTQNKTLVRNSSVTGGVTFQSAGFPSLGSQWIQFNQDDISNLGSHTFSGGSVQSFVSGYNGLAILGATTVSQLVSGLNVSTDYYYRIRSTNACSSSTNSNVINAKTTDYTTADFRSRQNGNYNDFNTWQYFDGTDYVNATSAQVPGTGNNVTIQSGHTVTLTANAAIGNGKTLTINSGGILQAGTFNVSGAGAFTLSSGATLGISSANGITSGTTASGNVQVTGTRTFNAAANYTYNGTANQVTGNGLPTPLTGTFTIANTGTSPNNIVTLSQATTLGATVSLTNGGLDLNGLSLTVSNGAAQSIAGSGSNNFTILGAANSVLALAGSSSHVITLSGFGTATGSGLVSGPNVNVQLNTNAQLDCGGNGISTSMLTVNGIFTINSAAASNIANAHPPFYSNTSTLIYGVGYNRYDEWKNTSGSGYPNNVIINTGTYDIYNGATGVTRALAGTLTIKNGATVNFNGMNAAFTAGGDVVLNSGGALNMNTMTGVATIIGNLTIAGTLNMNSMNKVIDVSGDVNLTGSLNLSAMSGGNLSLKGNWINNGTGSNFNANNSAVIFNGAAAQTIQGTNATLFDYPYLIINNTSGGVLLSHPVNISNTLTLTSGIVTTSATNILSLTYTGNTAISGGSVTSFINGPLRWSLPNSSAANYIFPLGSGSTYQPYAITNPGGGSPVVTLQAFAADAGAGATFDATGMSAISHSEYWNATLTSGSINAGTISLARTTISPFNVVARSAAQAGSYTSLVGSVNSSLITSNTITSATAAGSSLGYFVLATKISDPTISTVVATTPLNAQGNDNGYFGQEITITGTNFTTNATVTINGSNPFTTTYVSSTSIKVIVALGTLISGNLVVTNPTTSGAAQKAFIVLGYITRTTGDWNTNTTWMGGNLFAGAVPIASSTVVVNDAITVNTTVTNTPASLTISTNGSITQAALATLATTNFTNNGSLTTAGNFNITGVSSNAAGKTITVNSGGTYGIGGALTNSGTVTVNAGTLQINQGGSVSGTAVAYSGTSTLTYAGTATQTSTDSEFPAANGPANLTVNNAGGFRLHASRTISADWKVLAGDVQSATNATFIVTMSGANAALQVNGNINGTDASPNYNINLVISGAKTTISGSGTTCKFFNATVNAGSTLVLQRNFQVRYGSFLVNGMLQFDANASLTYVSPTYAANATLVYNTGGPYNRSLEWTNTTNPGYPGNVTINNTTLSIGTPGNDLGIVNNLTLGATGSAGSLIMDATPRKIVVGNDVTIGSNAATSTLTLSSNSSSASLEVGGNWNRTANGDFVPNGRGVFFTGSADKTITAAGGTETFDILAVQKSAATNTVSLANGTDAIVNNQLILNTGRIFTSATAGLTVNNTAATGITNGSANSFINGAVTWKLPNNSLVNYLFPVGVGSTYLPFTLTNPGGTSPVVTVQAFSGNAGGTYNSNGLSAISTSEYWQASVSGTLNATQVSLSRAALNPFDVVANSTTINGQYATLGGTVAGNTVTSVANAPAALNFFVLGAKANSPTITRVFATSTLNSQADNSGYYGQAITIQGTNFPSTATVTINGVAPINLVYDNSGQLRVTVNSTTTSGNLVVTNPDINASVTAATAFSVLGYITKGATDWNMAATWLGDGVANYTSPVIPPAASTVTINNAVTVNSTVTGSPSSLTVSPSGSIAQVSTTTLSSTNCTNNGTITTDGNFNITGVSSIAASKTITVNANGTFGIGATLTNSGTFTVNGGTLQMNQGGSVSGTAISYSGTSTLTYAGTSTQTSTNIEFAATNGPTNLVINNNGGFRLHASRTITGDVKVLAGDVQSPGPAAILTMSGSNVTLQVNGSITGAGLGSPKDISVVISGNKTTVTGTGSLVRFLNATVNSGSTLALQRSFDVSAGTFAVNGTLQIDAAGFVATTSPTYAASAMLIYNTSGPYNRSLEWTNTTNPGYPGNVTINNTTLSIGTPGNDLGIVNNLTLGATGSAGSLIMDATPRKIVVGNDVTIGSNTGTSTLTLSSNSSSASLEVGGNWNRTANGAFVPNGRGVFFTGSADKTITAAGGTETFDILAVQKSAATNTVSLANGTDAIVNNQLILNTGRIFTSATAGLTVNNTAATGITNGSANSFINGAVTWKLPNNSLVNYFFPVGAGTTYLPFALTNPGGVSPIVTVQAFTGSTGGGFDPNGIASLSTSEYWQITVNGTLNTGVVSAAKTSLGTLSAIAISAIQAGTYTTLGGTITNTLINGNTVTSTANAPGMSRFFVLANKAANPTISLIVATPKINAQADNTGYFGQQIRITGANFPNNATITINGTSVINIAYNSTTEITAFVNTGTTSGNLVLTNPDLGTSATVTFTVLGYSSNAASDWMVNSTWLGNGVANYTGPVVPAAGAVVSINHLVNISNTVALAPNTVTVAAGVGAIILGGGGVLAVNNTLSNNGTVNMTAGGVLNMGGNGTLDNTGTFTGGVGLVNFSGDINTTARVTGTPALENVTTSGGLQFINNAPIGGTFTLNAGGFINGLFAPTYLFTSTLKYNTGGTFDRNVEWNKPYNVQISGNTTLNAGGTNGANINADLVVLGNLVLDANSTLTMNASGAVMNKSLLIAGNLNLSGRLVSSGISGVDVNISGNWNRMGVGTFTHNQRSVFFKGTSFSTIASATTESFYKLFIDKTGGGDVTLANQVDVTELLTLVNGKINTTNIAKLYVTKQSSGAVVGGTTTNFINGPMDWLMPANNSANISFVFPVGKNNTFLPFTLVKPLTGATGPIITAEAYDAAPPNAANVDKVTVETLSNTENWKASAALGNLTSTSVSLARQTSINAGSVIAWSVDPSGTTYSSIGGTVSGNAINNSTPPIGNLGTFAIAISCPRLDFDYNGVVSLCTSGGTITPRFLNGGSVGNFTSTPALAGLNASTGAINLSQTASGTYTIKNNPAIGSCTNFVSIDIIITAQPSATINYNGSPYCSTGGIANVSFTGTSGGSYTASPAGLSINSSSGAITPSTSTAGTYTVTYLMAATGGCSTQTATTSVTITTLPSATIVYSGSPFCKSLATAQVVTQTGTSGGTYTASPAAGLIINSSTGAITPSTSTAGTYTVTYTMAATGGCSAQTATASVTITTTPTATISYNGSPFCKSLATAQVVTQTGTSGGSYTTSPAGLIINSSTGAITPSTSTAGTYTVTYTMAATGGCSAQTATASVTITTLPSATIVYSGSPFCKSLATAQVVTQTGTTGGTYTASPAGLTINPSTGAITPSTSTAGPYTVTYTMAASGGCSAQTASASVTITTLPAATISYSGSPFCKTLSTAQAVTQTGTTGGTYTVSPAGLTINPLTGAITPSTSTAGPYAVTYTMAASGGCSAQTATASVTITAAPSATISYTGSPFCSGGGTETATITGTTGGTFTSTAGLGITTSNGNINVSASTPGDYVVTYTVAAANGCNQFITTTNVTVSAANTVTWTGAVNSNWTNGGNWNCGLPSTAVTIVIPATGNQPVIGSGTTTQVKDVILKIGALLTVSAGELQIASGTITNNGGSIDASAGTINYNGTAAQQLEAALFKNNTIKNLKINNAAGVRMLTSVTIGSALTLTSGSLLLNHRQLTLNGSFSGTPSNALVGSIGSNVVIGASYTSGNLIFDRTVGTKNNYLNSLILNTSATLGDSLHIAPSTEADGPTTGFVKVNSGVLNTGDKLVLTSEANGTARIAQGDPTTPYILGKVTVQRFIPLKRAWRLITAPITGNQTINQAWQEGQQYNSQGSAPKNFVVGNPAVGVTPTPGFGTHITGGTAPYFNPPTDALNFGFDVGVLSGGAPSIRKYADGNFSASNPNALKTTNIRLSDNPGYLLFVRGDRTIDPANTDPAQANDTRLQATDIIGQNDKAVITIQPTFTLVANPYPSPIDFNNFITRSENSGIMKQFYIWDSKLNTLGGYRLIAYDPDNNIYYDVPTHMSDPDATVAARLQDIQSGHAFFIQAVSDPASLTIREEDKSDNINTSLYSNRFANSIHVNLYTVISGTPTLVDGVLSKYSDNFNEGADRDDVAKPNNLFENFAIFRDNRALMIEARPSITYTDTIFFRLTNTTVKGYQLKMQAGDFSNAGLTAVLIDKYLNLRSPVSLNGSITTFDFNINSDAGSKDPFRFMIVFTVDKVLPLQFIMVRAGKKTPGVLVEWKMDTEAGVLNYEIERSAEGNTFYTIGHKQVSRSIGHENYSFLDNSPLAGENFYRIKAAVQTGVNLFSKVVKVITDHDHSAIVIFPNPAQGNKINLHFSNQPKGTYKLGLVNHLGQTVYSGNVNHAGGSASQQIDLKKLLPGGIYQLHISNHSTNIFETVIIQ